MPKRLISPLMLPIAAFVATLAISATTVGYAQQPSSEATLVVAGDVKTPLTLSPKEHQGDAADHGDGNRRRTRRKR
jgi:hypothetical protein